MPKLRSDSFAAGLTASQRDELFAALVGGLGYDRGADWVKSHGRPRPSPQAVQAWYAGAKAERAIAAAREVALVTEANCPADYDAQARRALGQQKFLAVLAGLSAKDVAALQSVDIAQQKVDLDAKKLALEERRLRLDQEKFERLVLEKLSDLAALGQKPGLTEPDRLAAVRRALWGAELAEEVR
jgi:hypothetical protein